jgi:hypothetical protein
LAVERLFGGRLPPLLQPQEGRERAGEFAEFGQRLDELLLQLSVDLHGSAPAAA